MLGDYLSTGLGVLGLSWQASPALTELEEVMTDWMRQMVGLSAAWSGVIQDTASTSTLVALICARERASGYALAKGGLQGGGPPLTVYVSAHSHSSVEKAALLAGFGRDYVRAIEVDARHYAVRPDALRAAIQADLAKGLKPCAIVGTSGTTTSTAFDPLAALAEIAKQHGTWLHVDAAMAGSAMILPEMRPLWDGHRGRRLAGVQPAQVARRRLRLLALLRARSRAPDAGDGHQPELPAAPTVDGEVKNLRDWGIPLGRRFRALKLWCLLREQGVEALRAAAAARSRQRAMARERRCAHAGMARGRPGPVADGLPAPRAAGARRRGARPPYARLGRAHQPLRPRLSDAGDPGRPLDGARLDRRAADRACARRGALGAMRAAAESA